MCQHGLIIHAPLCHAYDAILAHTNAVAEAAAVNIKAALICIHIKIPARKHCLIRHLCAIATFNCFARHR